MPHIFARGGNFLYCPLFVSSVISREGVCALCCGCEPLRCPGPGLPDDSPAPQSPGVRAACATESLDFPEPRLPATADRAGQKTPGREVK